MDKEKLIEFLSQAKDAELNRYQANNTACQEQITVTNTYVDSVTDPLLLLALT